MRGRGAAEALGQRQQEVAVGAVVLEQGLPVLNGVWAPATSM
jgi:hypothetical protein